MDKATLTSLVKAVHSEDELAETTNWEHIGTEVGKDSEECKDWYSFLVSIPGRLPPKTKRRRNSEVQKPFACQVNSDVFSILLIFFRSLVVINLMELNEL